MSVMIAVPCLSKERESGEKEWMLGGGLIPGELSGYKSHCIIAKTETFKSKLWERVATFLHQNMWCSQLLLSPRRIQLSSQSGVRGGPFIRSF